MIYRFQPRPSRTRLHQLRTRGGTVSAILRDWPEGMTGFCRLCERCGAADDRCLVMVNEAVRPEDAAMFSSLDFQMQPGGRRDGGPDR